jgi:hypothetical protein
MLLNSELVLEEARALAGRVLVCAGQGTDACELIRQAYRLALSRTPSAEETERGVKFLQEQASSLNPGPKPQDLPTPLPEGRDSAQAAALVDFCHVLVNLNEFVFVD